MSAPNLLNKEEELDNTSIDLSKFTVSQLKQKCKDLGLKGYSKMKKDELIKLINGNNNDDSASNNDIEEELDNTSIDLSKLTVSQLKQKCKDLGLKGYSNKKKDELIELINGNNNDDSASNNDNNDNEYKNTSNVLTLCPIPEFIDIETVKAYIENYMRPRLPFYNDTERPLYIEDEFSEYFTAKASNGKVIGGGHCAMDVKSENNGIDAMCVIMNSTQSNEKSLIQNFKSSGTNLDSLFIEKKDTEAVKLYMTDYLNKLTNVKKDKELSELYILAFISTETDVYISCLNLDIEQIQFVTSGGFIDGKKGKDSVSIKLNNFIESNIGEVKLYKSKKRVELRFKKKILNNENVVKIYSMP